MNIDLIKKLTEELQADIESGADYKNNDKYNYLLDNVPSIYSTLVDKIPGSMSIIKFMFDKMSELDPTDREKTDREVYDVLNKKYVEPLGIDIEVDSKKIKE
jgi:hypothetical protein